MYNGKNILCIIPARGGSKRLPGKNIKPLNGKPLIGYAIEAAKGSKYIDRIIVSTDDGAIAAVAKEFGAEVPFMRPAELASDTASTLQVLQHAVSFAEKEGSPVELVVLMQPTVPGVQTTDVDSAIEKIIETGANTCISICEITDPPTWMYRLGDGGVITQYVDSANTTRSQDLEKLYKVNGAVYVTKHDVLMKEGKIVDQHNNAGVVMSRERSVDIDTALDFELAEFLLTKQGNI